MPHILNRDKILPTEYKIAKSLGMNQDVSNICPAILAFQSEFYHLRFVAAVFCVYEKLQLSA